MMSIKPKEVKIMSDDSKKEDENEKDENEKEIEEDDKAKLLYSYPFGPKFKLGTRRKKTS